MRTIIAGSRTITNYEYVVQAVRDSGFDITTVVSGSASGVDQLGEQYAQQHGLALERFPADWDRYGKRAGYIRNAHMADRAEALIAVTTGSPGTRNMILVANKKGLKVFVKNV